MTIKSLDMQVMVQKIGEVARIQQSEQTGANNKQQEFTEAINAQTIKNSKATPEVEQHKPQLNTNKDKDKDKRDPPKKARKKAVLDNESMDSEFNIDPDKGHNVDIKI